MDRVREHAASARRRPLGTLAPWLTKASDAAGVEVGGITEHSHEVRPGDLFVAIQGTQRDGHEFVDEAVARGAAALLIQRPLDFEPGIPVIQVEDTRTALPELAAAWHGSPADRMRLIGITGTIGKTSVLKALEAMLRAGGQEIGTIGTLGVSVAGTEAQTGYTAPDPMRLHGALARFADEGCGTAAMEVTSHALDQERVRGLRFDLGVFTNLVPLEHADYHGSFRAYVQVKRRFLRYLKADAPLIYSEDDQIVRHIVRSHPGPRWGCGTRVPAVVQAEGMEVDTRGTRFDLVLNEELRTLDGEVVPRLRLPLQTELLGRPAVVNAMIAATAALCAGATPAAVARALAGAIPLRRRMQLIDFGDFWVMDDGASHPDSVSALFEVVEQLPVNHVHAVFAIRGRRGEKINRGNAEALAIWALRRPLDRLILTRSEDAVDELNRVEPEERDAFLSSLTHAGVSFEENPTLEGALASALEQVVPGDLVLLLGTQGMDEGATRLRRLLQAAAPDPSEGVFPA